MDEVRGRMGEADGLLRRLQLESRDTVNGEAIDRQQDRIDAIQANYKKVVDWAYGFNRRPPLVEGVFPVPDGPKKLEFREAYVAELERLLELIRAGEPPADREIADMREKIKSERPRDFDPYDGRSREPVEDQGAEQANLSGLITDAEAQKSPAARAAITKAQNVYCYANLDSLHVVRRMYSGGIELPPEVLWDAQRSLWIVQDVVEAVARLNQQAADALSQQGVQPWVGVLPVKEITSIRVSNYVFEDSEGSAPASPAAPGPAEPPGSVADSFTYYFGTDLYDVMQFTVKLVVDARKIPLFMEEICRDRFYTPIRVAYVFVPPNLNMSDKIYGEDPAVRLVIDFEAYAFGDIYRRLMPDAILDEIARERPTDGEETEG
jgi:hypothetical protein